MDNVHIVKLGCHHCHGEHPHEVTYAGRLLASTLCSNCGHRIARNLTGLRRAYLADVEHRILFKLGALLLTPARMEAELRVLRTGRR